VLEAYPFDKSYKPISFKSSKYLLKPHPRLRPGSPVFPFFKKGFFKKRGVRKKTLPVRGRYFHGAPTPLSDRKSSERSLPL
jgi:hypothetical protein